MSARSSLTPALAFVGFGEAGRAFASGANARGYDRLLDDPALSARKTADFIAAGVECCPTIACALAGADTILSLVTADQALAAAESAANHLEPDAIWLDMNSVSPATKCAARDVIDAAGARYVDVAVMASVHPAGLDVPLLLSGEAAGLAASRLSQLGFSRIRIISETVGAAAAIKMIRSVMIKGIEALSAECMLAATRACVLEDVVGSLEARWPGADWRARLDHDLGRMLVHGERRAAEMDEAASTLVQLGVAPCLTRGTVNRQRDAGKAGAGMPPPPGLEAKLAVLLAGSEAFYK